MARVRSIHPGAPVDEDVARMSIFARHLWAYLPCHADREGRLKDAAFTLKLAIIPTDDVDVDALLGELVEHGHIIRYEADGRRYIQIRSFTKYQTPHVRETASTIPAPTKASPRQTLAMASTPIPDPDPIPSPEDLSPSPRDLTVPVVVPQQPTAKPWSGEEWRQRFAKEWQRAHDGNFYGRGAGDAKATGNLSTMLDELPLEHRVDAQARAGRMFTEFLADRSPKAVAERHQFSYFVLLFNGLRVDRKQPARGTGPPRDVRVGHVRAEDCDHTAEGEQAL